MAPRHHPGGLAQPDAGRESWAGHQLFALENKTASESGLVLDCLGLIVSLSGCRMKNYVLGFAFDQSGHQVLLIHKNRPTFQAGLWNGVGGKIEAGESPLKAMLREFHEETGLAWPAEKWLTAGTFGGNDFTIHVFGAQGDIHLARSLTDEVVAVHGVSDLSSIPVVSDLFRHLDHLRQHGVPCLSHPAT